MKLKRRIMIGLVVLVGVAVLAGFLLPSLCSYRECARRTQFFGGYVSYASRNQWEPAISPPNAIAPGEELWIIERPSAPPEPADPNAPGSGALMAKLPDQDNEVPVPLKHTAVQAFISGYIATVDVTQQFHNPYSSKIEAVYIFPLPTNAAVNEFIMTVGERRIRGIIRERQEAERIYYEARRQGYVASLLTQERPNVFTQRVANIEPGKQIDVNIKYFSTLEYADGWYEFVFPMVVGPRFNPPGSTGGIGAAARGSAGASGQATEVQYLKPGERSGHNISLSVQIAAGVPIEDMECTTHAITKSGDPRDALTVSLSPLDTIPNKDFVLRYKVAGKTTKSSMLTCRDARGGFFTIMQYRQYPEARRNLLLAREKVQRLGVTDGRKAIRGFSAY